MPHAEDITGLLSTIGRGDALAWDRLVPLVYTELRDLAHVYLLRERADHTLNTTALVHEAYLRLVKYDRLQWQNRNQFFGIAAHIMREILINYARMRVRLKRGGGQTPLSLEALKTHQLEAAMSVQQAESLLDLDEALERLGKRSPRQRQIVEIRFFSGLTIEETADALGLSTNTVTRDWSLARAWLNRELQPR